MSPGKGELSRLGRGLIEAAGSPGNGESPPAWQASKEDFPFEWGNCWTQCVEYVVADFEAEVGFYLDVLKFQANALSEDYAMLTDPGRQFFLSFSAAKAGATPTAPDAIKIGFMIEDIEAVATALEGKGITFEKPVSPYMEEGGPLMTGRFRTPNKIMVDLWGMKSTSDASGTGSPTEP